MGILNIRLTKRTLPSVWTSVVKAALLFRKTEDCLLNLTLPSYSNLEIQWLAPSHEKKHVSKVYSNMNWVSPHSRQEFLRLATFCKRRHPSLAGSCNSCCCCISSGAEHQILHLPIHLALSTPMRPGSPENTDRRRIWLQTWMVPP